MTLYGLLEQKSGYLRKVPACVNGMTEYVPLLFSALSDVDKYVDTLIHSDAKFLTIIEFSEVP